MDKPETNAPATNDVLQSDHHVHMSDEEIAKARAHHDRKHGHEQAQNDGKKMRPGQPANRSKMK